MIATEEHTEHAAYVIGEVEHLLSFNTWPPIIADRLGYRAADYLRYALHRWGRADLAAKFSATAYDPLSIPDQRGKAKRS